MAVAERTSAAPVKRLRFRPVGAASAESCVREPILQERVTWPVLRERTTGVVSQWLADVLACKHLLAVSLVLTTVALYTDYYCGAYVTSLKGVKAPDLILDQFQAVDLSFLFVYGYMALIVAMFAQPVLFRVRTLHVVAIQFSLLLILRSVFMLFTHIETPAGSIAVGFPSVFEHLYFENDMFFSGHTAMPFLGFYLFRRSWFRYVFLVGAVVMGMVVLAMHLHYSIDVFSAFFMTYCSYRIGNRLLLKIDPTYVE